MSSSSRLDVVAIGPYFARSGEARVIPDTLMFANRDAADAAAAAIVSPPQFNRPGGSADSWSQLVIGIDADGCIAMNVLPSADLCPLASLASGPASVLVGAGTFGVMASPTRSVRIPLYHEVPALRDDGLSLTTVGGETRVSRRPLEDVLAVVETLLTVDLREIRANLLAQSLTIAMNGNPSSLDRDGEIPFFLGFFSVAVVDDATYSRGTRMLISAVHAGNIRQQSAGLLRLDSHLRAVFRAQSMRPDFSKFASYGAPPISCYGLKYYLDCMTLTSRPADPSAVGNCEAEMRNVVRWAALNALSLAFLIPRPASGRALGGELASSSTGAIALDSLKGDNTIINRHYGSYPGKTGREGKGSC